MARKGKGGKERTLEMTSYMEALNCSFVIKRKITGLESYVSVLQSC
jgi:hypothetical protein